QRDDHSLRSSGRSRPGTNSPVGGEEEARDPQRPPKYVSSVLRLPGGRRETVLKDDHTTHFRIADERTTLLIRDDAVASGRRGHLPEDFQAAVRSHAERGHRRALAARKVEVVTRAVVVDDIHARRFRLALPEDLPVVSTVEHDGASL